MLAHARAPSGRHQNCRGWCTARWAAPASPPAGRLQQRGASLVPSAKKQKKGGQKKGPSKLATLPKPGEDEPEEAAAAAAAGGSGEPWSSPDCIMINFLLVENYARKTGRPLLDGGDLMTIANDLYHAPFALLYHNSGESPDQPVFQYANQAALDLFEASWEELIGMPSSKAAADPEQEARSDLLQEAAEKGVVDGCSGKRRTMKGREFEFRNGTLFNVDGADGEKMGQSVVLRHWVWEDGTHGGPDAPAPAVSEVQVDEAKVAVLQQAERVRELKDGEGRGNADPEVQEAVEELLSRKAAVERLETTLSAGQPEPHQQPEPDPAPEVS